MSAFDSFPLGQPAFITHILDRAAHLRSNEEDDGPRALLTRDEALAFGANPGTIFLGLRDGAAVFGMGIKAEAVEKLLTRNDVAVTELRGMAMQGAVPPEQLSAIAMAKSMVSWHQRHGFCANCGTRSAMKEE